jgi:hypothetical protein
MGGTARLLASVPLSPAGWTILLRGLAAVGFVLLAKALWDHGIEGAGGGGGIDAIAYWSAGGNVRQGLPLYTITEGELAAYAYPPPFAQLLTPLSLLPMPAFVWLWRAVELVSLRIAAGSWTAAGIALLVLPPVIAELDAGNIHLIVAAVTAMTMRRLAHGVAPAALLKFASAALVPLAWQRDRRGLLVGAGVAAAVTIASVLVSPNAWADYVRFLGTTSFPSGWYNLLEGVPLVLRLAVAFALAIAALRWVRLAPLAVLLAYPVVWFHALSTLVAVVTPINRSAVLVPGADLAPGLLAVRNSARLAERA